MKLMKWKRSIGKGNITPQEGEILLRHFEYPPFIDDKGRLMIDIGTSKIAIAFIPNGEHSTWVDVFNLKNNLHRFLSFILVLIILISFYITISDSDYAFLLPFLIYSPFTLWFIFGFIFVTKLRSYLTNSNRKKVFLEAVSSMNQNLDKLEQ